MPIPNFRDILNTEFQQHNLRNDHFQNERLRRRSGNDGFFVMFTWPLYPGAPESGQDVEQEGFGMSFGMSFGMNHPHLSQCWKPLNKRGPA